MQKAVFSFEINIFVFSHRLKCSKIPPHSLPVETSKVGGNFSVGCSDRGGFQFSAPCEYFVKFDRQIKILGYIVRIIGSELQKVFSTASTESTGKYGNRSRPSKTRAKQVFRCYVLKSLTLG